MSTSIGSVQSSQSMCNTGSGKGGAIQSLMQQLDYYTMQQQKIEQNNSLSDKEKQMRIENIQKQIDKINEQITQAEEKVEVKKKKEQIEEKIDNIELIPDKEVAKAIIDIQQLTEIMALMQSGRGSEEILESLNETRAAIEETSIVTSDELIDSNVPESLVQDKANKHNKK